MKKILTFLVTIFIVSVFFYLLFPQLTHFMTFENIKASHDNWVALYQQSPVKIVSLFIAFNIMMAMLPVPGISMISFLGGALFGFIPGVIYSSVATAIGNLAGFFIARYFLQDYVYARYGDKLRLFRSSFQAEGVMALFSFRLFPFVPSFVANLIMGVSALNWWSFFLVSWVGRIPMVLVYAWSGVQVAKIQRLEDILGTRIIFAFILLAALPWMFKFLFNRFKPE